MARRTRTQPLRQNADLSIEQMELAIPRLMKRVEMLRSFQPETLESTADATNEKNRLSASIDDALVRTFGADTVEYKRYQRAAIFSWPVRIGHPTPLREIVEKLASQRTQSITLLESAIASLEEQVDEVGLEVGFPDSSSEAPNQHNLGDSRKIFIVHGHDVAARETVARFLEKCGFEPIVLHEQPNLGRTIIEKFEVNADVGFAVVLMSPDDQLPDQNGGTIFRTRQNVILELGYFIGRLGRDRVAALKCGDLELPSDILGVVWTELDANGAWKQALAKELEAADYEIDWNQVMRS